MKRTFNILVFFIAVLMGCKKDMVIIPTASFSFRGDTTTVLKMATYDTCTLVNNSVNSDSSFWDLGDGNISKNKELILSYPRSGTYIIKLMVKNKGGQTSSETKTVIVLDRVLKKIILKSVYWDTIPNSIPNFNAVWPTASKADVFILIQKFASTDSIVPYSGILLNSPILFQSPTIRDVASNTTLPVEIDIPGKFIIDKKMVLDRSFTVSLMAKDTRSIIYALQTSLESGCSFGIQQESFEDNKFILLCNLFSSIELDCDFE